MALFDLIGLVLLGLLAAPLLLGLGPARHRRPQVFADGLSWEVETRSRSERALAGGLGSLAVLGTTTAVSAALSIGFPGVGPAGLHAATVLAGTLLGSALLLLLTRWRAAQTVVFKASLDGVRIKRGRDVQTLAWEHMTSIEALSRGLYFDGTDPVLLVLPYATEDDKQAVVEACRRTHARAQPREQVPVPGALARLREG